MPEIGISFEYNRFDTEIEIFRLRDYLENMEAQIRDATWLDRLKIKAMLQLSPHVDEGEWTQAWDNHQQVFIETIPRIFRYTFVVALCFTLESRLRSLCREVKSRKELVVDVLDIRADSFVQTGKKYLVLIAHAPPPPDQIWQRTIGITKIRNCIVHSAGSISESHDQKYLRTLASEHLGFDINHEGKVELQPAFCSSALDTLLSFFDWAYNSSGFGPAISSGYSETGTHS
jgi:hypothetical protein